MKRSPLIPYLIWMVLFTVVPMVLVLYYAFTVPTESGVTWSLQNFARFFEPIYLRVLGRSIRLAVISTALCLILGYPAAMVMAGNAFKRKHVIMLLFVVPMWMNFLLRTYAWLTILERNGFINALLSFFDLPPQHLVHQPRWCWVWFTTSCPYGFAHLLGAEQDRQRCGGSCRGSGANPFQVFMRVILPLSLPGVVSGITMVFMPAMTTFVISRLLGGGQFTLIGNLIEQQFLVVGDWGFGSAISVVMIVVILLSMAIMSFFEGEEKDVALW